jgi:hypothetical protein
MLRLMSASLEASVRRRYSPVHVAARLAQLDEVLQRAADAGEAVRQSRPRCRPPWRRACGCRRIWQQRLQSAHAQTAGHCWKAWHSRLKQARDGFAALPLEDLHARAEAPHRWLSKPELRRRGPIDAGCSFDRLADLPRGVWLPTLITGAGHVQRRGFVATQAWLQALAAGANCHPPMPTSATRWPRWRQCAASSASWRCRACAATPALAEQVLRTLLWHLDRINDHQPR